MTSRCYLGSSAQPCVAIAVVAMCGMLTSACFGAKAQTVVAQPLDMPVPPPRVVEVSQPEMPPPVPLPEEPARTAPSSVLTQPPRGNEVARPAEPPRTEPVVETAKPAEDASKPPATTLQTTPAQRDGEFERRIRTLLVQAAGGLGRINYQALNTDGRTQYETAKRFINQAEEAVRAKNLVFAYNLADKAATLAGQLSVR
jgi:hypothetical protein